MGVAEEARPGQELALRVIRENEMPEETQFRPPAWQEPFRPCQIQQGARAVFQGVVTGTPTPSLTWTWRGRPLAEAGRAVTSYHPPSGQVTLAIDDLGPGDEGEYACKAENPWGDTTCTLVIITITIIIAITIIITITITIIIAITNVVHHCLPLRSIQSHRRQS